MTRERVHGTSWQRTADPTSPQRTLPPGIRENTPVWIGCLGGGGKSGPDPLNPIIPIHRTGPMSPTAIKDGVSLLKCRCEEVFDLKYSICVGSGTVAHLRKYFCSRLRTTSAAGPPHTPSPPGAWVSVNPDQYLVCSKIQSQRFTHITDSLFFLHIYSHQNISSASCNS